MPTRRAQAGRRVLTPLACALVVAAGAPVVAAPTAPFCHVMDVSPSFATDRTAFCGYAADSTLVVYRTTDAGRAWTRTDSVVLRVPDGSRTRQLVVSADYANDRSVFLATDTTLYVSRDEGETFLPLDRIAGDGSGRRVFTRYLDMTVATPVPYVAFAAYQSPARLSPPLHEAVPAALPANTDRFLIPSKVTASSEPLLIAFSGSGGVNVRSVYACTVTLACQTKRANVPGNAEVTGAWLSPSYSTDHTLYVATAANGFTFYRSTDAGASFHPWAPVNAALRPITKELVRRRLPAAAPPALGFGPGGRVYLRVVPGFVDDGRLPPYQVIFRSTDRGARWQQVAWSYDTGGRRRGTLPFLTAAHTTTENSAQLVVTPDGRLFAIGTARQGEDTGPWCSVDGGVRWYRLCPK